MGPDINQVCKIASWTNLLRTKTFVCATSLRAEQWKITITAHSCRSNDCLADPTTGRGLLPWRHIYKFRNYGILFRLVEWHDKYRSKETDESKRETHPRCGSDQLSPNWRSGVPERRMAKLQERFRRRRSNKESILNPGGLRNETRKLRVDGKLHK